MIVWLAVAAILLGRLVKSIAELRQNIRILRMRTSEPPWPLPEAVHKAGMDVVVSPRVDTPYLVGIYKPTILLPAMDFTPERLEYVIDHELQHHYKRDNLMKLLISIVCCLLWWNPVVYLLKYHLDFSLELQCDLIVTENFPWEKKVDYLDNLKAVMKHQREGVMMKAPTVSGLVSVRENRGGLQKKTSKWKKKLQEKVNEWQRKRQEKLVETRFKIVLNFKGHNKQKWANLITIVVFAALFVGSFFVIVQPYVIPEVEEYGFEILPGYFDLVEVEDGIYAVVIDGEFMAIVDDVTVEPFKSYLEGLE